MATRYSKFVMRKKRIERLKNEIGWLQALGDSTGAKVKRLKNRLDIELYWLDLDVKHAYEVIDSMATEQMKYITEVRYMDGKSWNEIKNETGLSLQRLYQINMKIHLHFADKHREDLLYSDYYSSSSSVLINDD